MDGGSDVTRAATSPLPISQPNRRRRQRRLPIPSPCVARGQSNIVSGSTNFHALSRFLFNCPLNFSPLTYPPKQFGRIFGVQRWCAKVYPRSRPNSVWASYKCTLAAASPFWPQCAWKGTWPFRRRPLGCSTSLSAPWLPWPCRGPPSPLPPHPRRRPRHLAVAVVDLTADPGDLAAAPAAAVTDDVGSGHDQ